MLISAPSRRFYGFIYAIPVILSSLAGAAAQAAEPQHLFSYLRGGDIGETLYHRLEAFGTRLPQTNGKSKFVYVTCTDRPLSEAVARIPDLAEMFVSFSARFQVPSENALLATSQNCPPLEQTFWIFPGDLPKWLGEITPYGSFYIRTLYVACHGKGCDPTPAEEYKKNLAKFVRLIQDHPSVEAFISASPKKHRRAIAAVQKKLAQANLKPARVVEALEPDKYPEFAIIEIAK